MFTGHDFFDIAVLDYEVQEFVDLVSEDFEPYGFLPHNCVFVVILEKGVWKCDLSSGDVAESLEDLAASLSDDPDAGTSPTVFNFRSTNDFDGRFTEALSDVRGSITRLCDTIYGLVEPFGFLPSETDELIAELFFDSSVRDESYGAWTVTFHLNLAKQLTDAIRVDLSFRIGLLNDILGLYFTTWDEGTQKRKERKTSFRNSKQLISRLPKWLQSQMTAV